MSEPSARERFVEAIREWIERDRSVAPYLHVHGYRFTPTNCARQAVGAFADAECGEGIGPELGKGDGSCYGSDTKEHAACRASLLRDCGLGDK